MIRLILSLLLLMPVSALAQTVNAEPSMRIRLLPGVNGTEGLSSIPVGLQIELAPGWYTYWRTPGDGGLAPQFDWSASANVKEVRVSWPAPKRYETEGLYSFGYDGHVILPLEVIPETPGQAVTLSLKMQAVACNKICVPHNLSALLMVPGAPAVMSGNQAALEEAKRAVPLMDGAGRLELDTAVLGMNALVLSATGVQDWNKADVFVEMPENNVLTARPTIAVDPNNPQQALISVRAPDTVQNLSSLLAGRKIKATLVDGLHSVEKEFSF